MSVNGRVVDRLLLKEKTVEAILAATHSVRDKREQVLRTSMAKSIREWPLPIALGDWADFYLVDYRIGLVALNSNASKTAQKEKVLLDLARSQPEKAALLISSLQLAETQGQIMSGFIIGSTNANAGPLEAIIPLLQPRKLKSSPKDK